MSITDDNHGSIYGLDEEQSKAVLDSGGPSIVIAGPGSGKTKVITHKIAYLISKGIDPKQILLVTFTKAAANEMIHRAQQVSENPLNGMMAGTFHHVCNYLLRKYAKELKLDPNFSILDDEDSSTIVKHAANACFEKNEKLPSPSVILKIISLAANTQRTVEKTIEDEFGYLYNFDDKIKKIKDKYDELKAEQSALDYDDLLVYADNLLDIPAVREREASTYMWVLVDEFQDTNKIQYDILKKLSSVHGNIMAVGDDAQSIYSFRGARYENIIEMSKEKGVKVYKIQTNYRSTPEIVNLINDMIPNNIFSKVLKPIKPKFERPVVVSTWDSLEEAEFVSKKINEFVNSGIPPFQIAVLYRNHSQSMDLQIELSKSKIPFYVRSGVRFTDSKHIKDVLAFLRVMMNPKDSLSWMRIFQLFYGVGKKSIDRIISEEEFKRDPLEFAKSMSKFGDKYEKIEYIFKKVSSNDKPDEILNHVFEGFYSDYLAMNFEDRVERQLDIKRIIEIAGRYDDINDFLTDLAITEEIDIDRKRNSREESVTLTTVHRAKGLEWDVVFVISVNPGDFPSSFAINDKKIDEEERVFYVAITRAKRYLYICRQMSGSRKPYYGNRMEINGSIYDFVERISPSLYEQLKID